ncbi:MAG: HEAT repeat domain-containing protein [Deltaproteobacteria bacterium]|nr:HEAT repeat domain-containing protein [Deltaproteobacteria bacterium]
MAYIIVSFIIIAVIILIVLTLIAVIARRLYMERRYRRLDYERERYSVLLAILESGRSIEAPDEYRHRPGSPAWIAVEENLFKAFDSDHGRSEAARLFDALGYTSHYIDTIESGGRWAQAMAAERLGYMRCARALPLLVKSLESRNTDLKLMVIHALGLIGDASVLPIMMKLLRSSILIDEEISRKVLISSIVSFGAEAVRALVAELADPDWRIRAVCLDLLVEIGGANLSPLFMKMLDDPEQEVRAKAAKGLGRIRCVDSVPRLEFALADQYWVVRLHAARALGLMREERSVSALTEKLTDKNWQVRRAAAEALGAIGGSAYHELLKVYIDSTDQYARDQAFFELGERGVAGALLSMLHEGENNYLLLKDIPPTGDKGGIGREVVREMLLFLTTLSKETLGQALMALLKIENNGHDAKEAFSSMERFKDFGRDSWGNAVHD